ncbi:MAG: hypothetical protein JST51_19900 [Armatimonadetes bacterium]|nr:hypothetical protein [Armatimonadota bacterium]
MKSITSAGVVIGLLFVTIAGLKVRERQEISNGGYGSLRDLFASRDTQVDIAEGDYYEGISDLLKTKYVDPIKDDQKLLTGAIRGMVTGLNDADSQFYNPNEFKAYKDARAGEYTGVGVWLDYKMVKNQIKVAGVDDDLELPRLMVVSVAPGSSADKAGVKVGDLVSEVDDHWVVNSEDILKYRKAQSDYLNKKIDFKTINDMRKQIKMKLDKSMSAVHAKEHLITGTTGSIKVTFERGDKTIDTTLEKGTYDIPSLKEENGSFVLLFTSGAPEALKSYISGKSNVTIDLRHNVLGDFETMRKCLSVIAPAGAYGYFENHNSSTPIILKTDTGNAKPPKIKLLVDPSTRDAAEVFALALSAKGYASLSGTEMGNSRKHHEICQLADGSGYTLATGLFKTGTPKPSDDKLAANDGAKSPLNDNIAAKAGAAQ